MAKRIRCTAHGGMDSPEHGGLWNRGDEREVSDEDATYLLSTFPDSFEEATKPAATLDAEGKPASRTPKGARG